MDTEIVSYRLHVDNNKQSKWWHHRRIKIIETSLTVFVVLVISLSGLLQLSISSPENTYSNIIRTIKLPSKIFHS